MVHGQSAVLGVKHKLILTYLPRACLRSCACMQVLTTKARPSVRWWREAFFLCVRSTHVGSRERKWFFYFFLFYRLTLNVLCVIIVELSECWKYLSWIKHGYRKRNSKERQFVAVGWLICSSYDVYGEVLGCPSAKKIPMDVLPNSDCSCSGEVMF